MGLELEGATENATATFQLKQDHGPLTFTLTAETYDNCHDSYSLDAGCSLNPVYPTHQIHGNMLIDTNPRPVSN